MQTMNLFCFPFAGGSKYSYAVLVKKAPSGLTLLPLDLPGRGTRSKEALLTDIRSMADDLFEQIKENLATPYALYGHSMGALLSYLVTQKIAKAGLNGPLFLFLTGCGSPATAFPGNEKRYLLPKKAFIEHLKSFGGSPDQIFEDDTLLSYFEPILRADFQAVDTYKHQFSDTLLHVPVTVITGTDEFVTPEEALAWRAETTGEFACHRFPGGHFFIYDAMDRVLKMLGEQAQKYSAIGIV